MIKEFGAFVANKAGLTVGRNLYVGWYPQDSSLECDVIQEYGGGPAFDLPSHWEAAIQIVSRAGSYHSARARSYIIYSAICRPTAWTIPALTSGGPAYLIVVEAHNIPQYLGRDGDGEAAPFEFVVNYLLHVERTA